MKELTKDFQENEIRSEVRTEQDQKKEIKFIGSQLKKPGLKLWEFNLKTHKLNKAVFKKHETIEIKSLSISAESMQKHSKVIINEHCIYFQALNEKSARKKISKL
jgi:hypothetical protein